MFLKKRKVNNTVYWSIAENYRENGKVKQRIILNLGNTDKAKKILSEESSFNHFLDKLELNETASIDSLVNQVFNEDCLIGMKRIPDKSIDMILCDLPYGTTKNHWDCMIPLDSLWKQYKRIIKDNGAIVLTAQTPFDKVLANSNLDMLRYEWIWEKTTPTGHLNANRMPMKAHENVLVFYKKLPVYNPQKTQGHTRKVATEVHKRNSKKSTNYGNYGLSSYDSTERFPRSVITFPTDKQKLALHPTQKPIALFEYFIRTYSNEGDIILDNAWGSGTTGEACIRSNRKYIGFEKDRQIYFDSIERVAKIIL